MAEPELHPALLARLQEVANGPAMQTLPVEVVRANLLARYGSLPSAPVGSVEDRTVSGDRGGLRLRIYRPDLTGPHPVLVFIHGGGFVIGSIETHDALCRQLCVGGKVAVVSVEYALAPEHRFPAGLEDSICAVRWVAGHAHEFGGDARRIILGGDSAGANLAVAGTLQLLDQGEATITGLLLAYPVTDAPNLARPSYTERGTGFGLTADGMHWFFEHYIDRPDRAVDPLVAILRSQRLADLPATWLLTTEFDPLRDEGIEFAAKLEAAGVDLTHVHDSSANHGFLAWAGTNEPSRRALEAACAWIGAREC